MAKDDKVKKARREAKFAAMEGLRAGKGFPIAPRKAMSEARKAGKAAGVPVAPFSGNTLLLFRWMSDEWRSLGKWQSVAAPIILVVALLTWEKETALREDYLNLQERGEIRAKQSELYGIRGTGAAPKKRKLLGIIPLPGRRK